MNIIVCFLTLTAVLCSSVPQRWYYYYGKDGLIFNSTPVDDLYDAPTSSLISKPPEPNQIFGVLGTVTVRGRRLLVVITELEDTQVHIKKVKKVKLVQPSGESGFIEESFEKTIQWLIQLGWYISSEVEMPANHHLLSQMTVEDPPKEIVKRAFSGHVGCMKVGLVLVCVEARQDLSRAGVCDYVKGMDLNGNVAGRFEITLRCHYNETTFSHTITRMQPPIVMTEKGIEPQVSVQQAAFQKSIKQSAHFIDAITDKNLTQALQAQLKGLKYDHYDPNDYKKSQPKESVFGVLKKAFQGQVNPIAAWASSVALEAGSHVYILDQPDNLQLGHQLTVVILRRLLLHSLTNNFKMAEKLVQERMAQFDDIVKDVTEMIARMTSGGTATSAGEIGWWALPAKERQAAMDWVYGTNWTQNQPNQPNQ